jgi:hypothetical protein
VAWPASDTGEGNFVLVIDACTGALTLPMDVLTRKYHETI